MTAGEKIFHPSSGLAKKAWEERKLIRQFIIDHPKSGIDLLKRKFGFGDQNELWDEYIFNTMVRPCLEHCCTAPIKEAVNKYAKIDECLFTSYIRREEDPKRFERAFWNVNKYGLRISERVDQELDIKTNKRDENQKKSMCIVFKGKLILAHTEFLIAFLIGCKYFKDVVDITVVLLDDDGKSLKGLDYIEVVSLLNEKDTYSKLTKMHTLCKKICFDSTVWVACVQNLALYMGMKRNGSQAYWSMKYHSIVMPTLDKYAAIGFGGKSFVYDGIEWFRGRAFPYLKKAVVSQSEKKAMKEKYEIPLDSKVIGCFVREEKTHGREFWEGIKELLLMKNDIVFILASQSLNEMSVVVTKDSRVCNRFKYIGWVNTKATVHMLDMYFDSYPRGSCNTIFEAIQADIPIVMTDTVLNRESSALIYLQGANGSKRVEGVMGKYSEQIKECIKILEDEEYKNKILEKQSNLFRKLTGQQILFAKDYLQYFLNIKLSIRKKVS